MTDDAAGKAADQLDAIASLDQALRAAGLDYWLFGGWAVDFWVGRLTRDHQRHRCGRVAAGLRQDSRGLARRRVAAYAARERRRGHPIPLANQRVGVHVRGGSQRDGRRPDPWARSTLDSRASRRGRALALRRARPCHPTRAASRRKATSARSTRGGGKGRRRSRRAHRRLASAGRDRSRVKDGT